MSFPIGRRMPNGDRRSEVRDALDRDRDRDRDRNRDRYPPDTGARPLRHGRGALRTGAWHRRRALPGESAAGRRRSTGRPAPRCDAQPRRARRHHRARADRRGGPAGVVHRVRRGVRRPDRGRPSGGARLPGLARPARPPPPCRRDRTGGGGDRAGALRAPARPEGRRRAGRPRPDVRTARGEGRPDDRHGQAARTLRRQAASERRPLHGGPAPKGRVRRGAAHGRSTSRTAEPAAQESEQHLSRKRELGSCDDIGEQTRGSGRTVPRAAPGESPGSPSVPAAATVRAARPACRR